GDHRAITGRLALVAAAAGRVARLAGAGRVAELEHRGLRALGIVRRALRAGIAALLAGARLVARAARETADALAVHAIREGAGGAAVRAELARRSDRRTVVLVLAGCAVAGTAADHALTADALDLGAGIAAVRPRLAGCGRVRAVVRGPALRRWRALRIGLAAAAFLVAELEHGRLGALGIVRGAPVALGAARF